MATVITTYNDRNQLLISSASRITGASVSIKNSFGNQLLVPKNSAVPYPQNITLTAVASKYNNPQYSWFYKIGTGEYTNLNLSTSVITLNLDADWLSAVGANTTVTYKVQVTEASGSLGINGTEAEFVVPVLREGTDAWNNIIVRIYRRNTTNTAPTIDRSASQSSTYSFSNGSLIGAPAGWSTSIPDTGGDFVFVSEYTAVSQLTSVQFTNDNWSIPVLYVKSGSVGNSGIVIYAYKRSATGLSSTDKPTNQVVYSFTTNTITTADLGGDWSKTIPSGTSPLYIVAATASSSGDSDTIATTEWSSPVEFVRNGDSGTSPIVGFLTNESVTVAASSNGNVASFTTAGGTFKVYEGIADKTGTGVTYSVVAGSTSDVTISIDTAGVYTVTAMSADTGTATLQAVYNGVTINKVYSIAKSRAGSDGQGAKYVELTTTSQAFAYNSAGAVPSPVTATFTATAYNTTGTLYYEFLVGATSKANTTNNTYIYTPQDAYSSMPEQITVKVHEGSATGTVVATDTLSVLGIKPGANGSSVAVPVLYARNNNMASAPAFTTTGLSNLVFTFASASLSGTTPINWYTSPPDISGGSVLWIKTAAAFSSDATYSIPWASWGDAKVLSTSGVRGSRNLYSNNAAYTSTYQPNPNLTAGLENYREKATQLIADATSGSIPTTPIKGDTVTFTNGSTYVFTLTYDGSAWNPPGTVIDGSLLVTGSVTAAKINSTGLTIRNAAGQVVFGAGTGQDSVNLDSQYISPASGWLNSNITIGGSNLVKGTGSGIGWTDYTFFFGNNANAFWKTNNTSSENFFYSPYFTLSGDREITVSFEAYNTTNVDSTEVYILPDDYASTGLLTWSYGKYSSYTKVSKTFTTPAAWGTDKQVRLRFDNNGSTGGISTIYVRNIKVEYGNKATDWSLHADEVNNRNITVDASGVLQGVGTSNITVNNQLVESTKLIASGNVTVSGTSIISSTAPGTWGTAQVYSSEGYAGGAYASFTVKAAGVARHFMAGLNTASDLTDGGYASLDFAFYFDGVNNLEIYESGNQIGNFGTYADGDTFAVVYDGFQIFYYKNGSVVRTKTQTVSQKLFFDSAIASTSTTPLLTNIKFSPLPSTSTAKNFADTSWWTWQDVNSSITTQYGVQWFPNYGTNKITTSRDALINQPSPLAGVSSDFVWYLTEPDSSNNAGGGWDANLNHTLDPTKTYRFVVPVMKLSGGDGSGNFYWGTYGVCDLNTTTTNTNPYFYSNHRSQLVENRWYLIIGYVFPYGSTNNTHEGAGLIDTTTGLYVGLGTNYAHTSTGASVHRAYQYYANAGNRQVFGRPEIYEVNGTEPPLSRYMTLASTMNASINVDSNGVLQGAGNQAVVANNKITVDSNGVLQGAGSQVSVGNNTDTAIREPGGGVYRTTTSTVTGALKIRLPQAFTNTMMKFTVEVYEYESGYSFTCEIGGYTFGSNNSNTWINTSARILGGSNVEYPVRFGFDGTKVCVWIGNQNETWSYPQVRVKDFFAGYRNTSASLWSSGWEISFDQTTLTTGTGANQYSSEILDTYPGADWSKTARRPANLSELTGSEPINNANIAVSLSSSGALSASGGPTVTGAVTIRGLGFVGDLAATSGKSLSPPLSNWTLNGTNTLETITDGKVGNQVVRLNIAGNSVNAPVFVPLDRSKIYRTRFWARPVNTNGLLYFALRQFKDTNGTTGDTNSGFSPYKPGGVSQATHNNIYGEGQWGEYTATWSSADWQEGVYFLLPTFLWNYGGTTGYWEIQDFTFEEVTEVVTAQAGANDRLSRTGASILSGVVTMDANYGSGFRAGNITWNSSGVVTSSVAGVAMTPGGIVSHNGTRTTFSLDSATGNATFGGTLDAAGGTFKGTLNVRSANSGARMEISNSVIKVYDANNILRVQIGDLTQ